MRNGRCAHMCRYRAFRRKKYRSGTALVVHRDQAQASSLGLGIHGRQHLIQERRLFALHVVTRGPDKPGDRAPEGRHAARLVLAEGAKALVVKEKAEDVTVARVQVLDSGDQTAAMPAEFLGTSTLIGFAPVVDLG